MTRLERHILDWMEKRPEMDSSGDFNGLAIEFTEFQEELKAEREQTKKKLPVDENGCHTLPNGDCIAPGPCLHTPPE